MNRSFYNPALLSMTKLRDRGVNAESTLNQNRRLILSLIKDNKEITRKQLVAMTGLKPATITIAINDFLDSGIVEKTGFLEGDSGRKVMGFRLARDKFCTIAVRLNVSYIAFGLYDINANNLFIKKMFMDTLCDIKKTCDILSKEIEDIRPLIGDLQVLAIGVAVEGPFIMKDGYYKLPDTKSPDGYFDLGKALNESTGYPVIINRENNFSVYCLWNEEFNKHQLAIIIMIMISYEVECGIMVNGEIINGQNGSAGLLGKLSTEIDEKGNQINFSDKVSTAAVLNRTMELMDKYPNSQLVMKRDDLNIRDVIKAFFENDELAIVVYTEVGKQIGRMIVNLVNLLNPDLVIICDEIPLSKRMENIIIKEAKRFLPDEVLPDISILTNRADRQTQTDPSLLGACHYITDAFIETSDMLTKKS